MDAEIISCTLQVKVKRSFSSDDLPITGEIVYYDVDLELNRRKPLPLKVGNSFTSNFTIKSITQSSSEHILDSDLYEKDPSSDGPKFHSWDYNSNLKLGDLVKCNGKFYYCRPDGSCCYLYYTIEDLENKRNRALCAARRRLERYITKPGVNVREIVLKDLHEESDVSGEEEPYEIPDMLTEEEREKMEYYTEIRKTNIPKPVTVEELMNESFRRNQKRNYPENH